MSPQPPGCSNGHRGDSANGVGSRRPLVVVGDALLDRDLDGRVERLCPDAPAPVVDAPVERARPGGAGLAAALAARDGRAVTLVTALGAGGAGAELAKLLDAAGVEVIDLGLAGETPEKVRVRAAGRTLIRVDRGGRGEQGGEPASGPAAAALDAARAAIAAGGGVLVSDYGRGLTSQPALREALAAAAARAPLVWDPHPRGAEPVAGALLVTPNAGEAARFASDVAGDGVPGAAARARALVRRWRAGHVCVTLGQEGAVLQRAEGPPELVPAEPASGGDPCGAGDRFASRAAGLLADGALPAAAVRDAVSCASALVAAGGAAEAGVGGPAREGRPLGGPAREGPLGGAPGWPRPASVPAPVEEVAALVARVRAGGGTVVSAGGCFDLLHAGHVSLLTAARALGDCLIVLLNSDDSVRRLKGADRPLVEEEGRAAVLAALACVDAVVVFAEDTPEAVLDRLRPDVFVKGGDYAVSDLPEAALLERWGGRAIVLPYVSGRSTSRLIEEVALRGGR